MPFRVAVGGISHETNTYCKEQTPVIDFTVGRGDEILANSHGVRSYLGGMLQAADELGATVVPTFFARATPSGTIAGAAYQSMREEAAAAGFYVPERYPDRQYPRIQILTIEELLDGRELQYPRVAPPATFKKAKRQRKGPEQGRIL